MALNEPENIYGTVLIHLERRVPHALTLAEAIPQEAIPQEPRRTLYSAIVKYF